MPFMTADSISFHYVDVGQGIPFVFQHGLGGDVQQTQDIFVPPIPFRLISLDCRGHGKTKPLGDPSRLGFSQFADDVLALLDHLRLEQVVIGGISMGAGVALNFALRHPQRVRGLILVRPAWLHEPAPPNLAVYPRIADLIRREGLEQGRDTFARSAAYLDVLPEFPQTAASILKQFARPQADAFAAVLERLPADAPNRHPAEWAQIRVPTQVLAHDRDPVHPLAYGATLAQAIPGASLTRITPKEVDAQQHNHDIRHAVEGFLGAL
jgi:pimeloyl-ACP methyl ester carboxylesterase